MIYLTQRLSDCRLVGHLKAVGHVVGKRHIYNGGLDAAVFNNIYHSCFQISCLPAKCAARLKYHFKIGVTLLECFEHAHQMVGVISLASHQVTAPHVDPLELWHEFAELAFDSNEHLLEVVRR